MSSSGTTKKTETVTEIETVIGRDASAQIRSAETERVTVHSVEKQVNWMKL